MAAKRQVASWIKIIEKRMHAVAKERDTLDEAITEMEDLRETCRKAHESLIDARDALSELV